MKIMRPVLKKQEELQARPARMQKRHSLHLMTLYRYNSRARMPLEAGAVVPVPQTCLKLSV